MPSIFDGFLKQVAEGDNIKDYQHAARLFVDNNYELSPKYSWLFHVYFELNPALTTIEQRQQIEAGMLVKAVSLPGFRVDSKTLNNYNRPSIVQSKIKYDDINITFYDDSANVIRKLWFDYYNYYYRDMDNNYSDSTGRISDVYQSSNKQVLGRRALYNKFGYSPRDKADKDTQYITAIRIYSLHQKRFSEYTLINPMITSFGHGQHSVGQDGTLENSMTISYESLLYAGGAAKVARGFATDHYDKAPSPLTPAGGGTNSILGPGGLVSVLDEVITDGSGRKWGSSAFKLVRGYQKNKNVDLVNLARGELVQSFSNILRNSASTGSFNFGGAAAQATYIPYRGVGTGSAGAQSGLATQTTAAPGSVNSNGLSITAGLPSTIVSGVVNGVQSGISGITNGISSALSGNPLTAIGSGISGVVSSAQGLLQGGDLNKVVDIAKDSVKGLTATNSSPLPTSSFSAAITAANERLKGSAIADYAKTLQESLGKSESFFTGPNAQGAVAAFQTGTNNLASAASSALNSAQSALKSTPFNNLQFAAGPQVSNLLSSAVAQAQSAANYIGKTSTNPIGAVAAFQTGGQQT